MVCAFGFTSMPCFLVASTACCSVCAHLQPRPGIGAAAAAGEGGSSIALARKGSLAGKGAPKIHLLDEAEQQEMHEVLQKSMKAKGHGWVPAAM